MKNRYTKVAKISEAKMRALVKLFALDIPALTSAQLLSLNRNTVQRYYDGLRLRILDLATQEAMPVTGEVEVDESYFGARRVRGKRGRGASGKTPVIGLLKRGGKVFTQIVANCSKQELMPIIKGQVLSQSTVYTDGWKSYDGLVLGGYEHHRIHHHQNQFARGKNHVNGIESFWSFAKLRMAKLRGIRSEYFLLHLKESEWRFNHRHDNIYHLLLSSLRKFPLVF
jgi:transposase